MTDTGKPEPHRCTRIAVYAALYLAGVVLNAGAMNADFRGMFRDFKYDCTEEYGRRTLATSLGFSLIPITWIMSPFMTGFFYHGWTLNAGPWGVCKHD